MSIEQPHRISRIFGFPAYYRYPRSASERPDRRAETSGVSRTAWSEYSPESSPSTPRVDDESVEHERVVLREDRRRKSLAGRTTSCSSARWRTCNHSERRGLVRTSCSSNRSYRNRFFEIDFPFPVLVQAGDREPSSVLERFPVCRQARGSYPPNPFSGSILR